jgi:hypothetical protein
MVGWVENFGRLKHFRGFARDALEESAAMTGRFLGNTADAVTSLSHFLSSELQSLSSHMQAHSADLASIVVEEARQSKA